MNRFQRIAVLALALLLSAGMAAAEKIKVEKADDLPRYTYQIDVKPSQLLTDEAAYQSLAAKVRADAESLLEQYDIQDAKTLQGVYSLLQQITFIEGDYEHSFEYLEKSRDLEQKEAQKLMMGNVSYAYVDALEAGDAGSDAFRAALQEGLSTRLQELPWDVVQDMVQMLNAQMQMISDDLIVGMIQGQMDGAVEKAGNLSGDQARTLIAMHSALHTVVPYKDEIGAAMADMMAAHKKEEKANIWPERDVTFTGEEGYSPVVIGVWDSGVDAGIFGEKAFTNPAETPDGKDDDGNGFVDDIHGIAFDFEGHPVPGLLYPLGDQADHRDALEADAKGFSDLSSGVESDEAAAVRKKVASLGVEDAKPFMENLSLYSHHAHGTHVAGIATAGNPYAKVLTARLTFDHRMTPEPYTKEIAKRTAKAYQQTVDYFKDHGVRVVNMSWGFSIPEIEGNLEANGIGKDAEDRRRMAREMFKITRDGLYNAIASAPDIIFCVAAGNSDNDVEFDEFIPSGFDLPNVLVSGAVDQAGEATGFTSEGRTVRVYANGFEVDSYVPGGNRVKMSGTSMASPNVANLAGKLVARDPSLTPEEVAGLIIDGADNMGEDGKTMRVINPKKSLELLNERHHTSP
jgi:hypothetical protein